MNLAMAGSLSLLWAMVNSLQIIAFYVTLQVTIPATCLMILEEIYKVACFDFVGYDDVVGIFKDEAAEEELTSEDEVSINMIDDLGLPTTLMLAYILIGALFVLLATLVNKFVCKGNSEKIKKAALKVSGSIFWNLVLRIVLESYLEYLNNSGEAIKAFHWARTTEKLYTLAHIMILTVFVGFPVFTFLWVIKNKDKLHEPQYIKKFGALTLDLDLYKHNHWQILFNVIFMLRRLFYGILILFFVSPFA